VSAAARSVAAVGGLLLLAVLLAACGAAGTGGAVQRAHGSVGSTAASRSVEAAAAPSVTASLSGAPTSRPAAPPPTPCTPNRRAQWIFVDLSRQHMWMCERSRVARDTAVTTGMRGPDTETPTGNYRIQGLNRNSVLTLANGQTYPVKYWIPFDAPLFGFHDSSWQRFAYGSPRYETAGSHGCVHMPLPAIRFLYGWAQIGTRVTIRA
jgi:lipoprotein-anchoring transpeptidase ErfK/SrfK